MKQELPKTLSQWKEKSNHLLSRFKEPTSVNLVGLDVGSDFLRLLKINSTESGFVVENFDMRPLPSGLIAKDEIKNPAALGAVLKEMFKSAEVTTKDVAFAITRSSAIIKNIMVDSRLNAEDIESRAWIEANRLFPDLVGDIYLDFTIVGPSAQDSSQLEMILVACRKDQVNPFIEALKEAGLNPKVVDVNCYALERAMVLLNKSATELDTVALLNLNMSLSSFIVIHQGHLIHAHDQSYDGRRLVDQVQKYLEEKKSEAGLLEDPGYNEILKESLLSHLRHTIHLFYSSRPNINIQQIVLAGDCATIPGLCMFMQKEIGIETVMADPFVNMTFAPKVKSDVLKANASTMMLCSGLALANLE